MIKTLTFLVPILAMGTLTAVLPSAVFASSPGSAARAPDDGGVDARCTLAPHSAGLMTHSIVSDGVERSYVVFVPQSRDSTRPLPVVIELHGSGSRPEEELAISGMAAAAEERGLIVVLPIASVPLPGGGFTWNVPRDGRFPDDVSYVRDVLDDVSQRLCVDPERVYTMGFSGGARLATEVACALSDRIAALGAVGGLRAPAECQRPVPVVAFHGTSDPINPYAGGGPGYWGYGVDSALEGWIAGNRCADEPLRVAVAADVEKLAYASCAEATEVVLYRLQGAGHVWPGSSFEFPRERFGVKPQTIDATELILDFFERHRLATG